MENTNSNGLEHADVRAATIAKLRAEAARAEAEAAAAQLESQANAARLNNEAFRLESEAMQLRVEHQKMLVELDDLRIAHQKKIQEQKEELARHKYHNLFYFKDEVSSSSSNDCMTQIDQWRRIGKSEGKDPQDIPINIHFTSPGGSVLAGLVLFDYLQEARRAGHLVTTGTYGYAASMAGILLQAGDVRWIGAGAWVLIHEISAGAIGKIGEIEDQMDWLRRIQKHVVGIFAQRAFALAQAGKEVGREVDEKFKVWESQEAAHKYIELHWKRKDWWLDANECLKHGFVDEIR